MTKQKISKLKEIFKTIEEAYSIIDSATTDREKDIEFIFGTNTKPNWAAEDHVHLNNGQIIDIKLREDKIVFRNENWINAFGEKICGFIKIKSFTGENTITETKKGLKKEYYPSISYGESYFSDFSRKYLNSVEDGVLNYLINNFNIEEIKSRTKTLGVNKSKCEFGLSLKKDNYYQTTKKN